jgi:hypothetical protein
MEEIDNMWFNQIVMRRGKVEKLDRDDRISDRFSVKARLNLNDLLRRRTEEKQIDKKANLIILSSAATVVAVVLLILNL